MHSNVLWVKYSTKTIIMKRSWIFFFMLLAGDISFAQQKITNPVLNQSFPDPTVIRVEGKYYAYATNTGANKKWMNIPVAVSTDLQHWNVVGDALSKKPTWANKDFWAPHVLYDSSIKKFVLFYSGESISDSIGKCLGVAFADNPEGPFVDKGTPLICGETFVNIDPMAIIDSKSGKKLLYWGSAHLPLKVQEMNNDWTAFKEGSVAQPIVYPNEERNYEKLLEGAWVHYYKGFYYIYYSGNNCCGPQSNYAVMVARAKNPFGPFETLGTRRKNKSSVILEKNKFWHAPGHNSIFSDEKGNFYFAYHAIPIDPDGKVRDFNKRVFCIDPIRYKKGWPVVGSGQ